MNRWVLGARPRTLPAAAVPVVVGSAVAFREEGFVAWRGLAALVVALGVQIGTNYVNDYADGVRGTDDVRVGPVRLVASKLASPEAVKRAAVISFAIAAGAGLSLAAVAGWQLALVGAAAILAGWLYTGGPRPYGYAGLGELFVFVFFGLVATIGTTYVHVERIVPLAVVVAVPVGLWAVALLVVNNLRDRVGDTAAGKRTLAVRLGDNATRALFVACLGAGVAVAALVTPIAGLAFAVAFVPAHRVWRGATGKDLIEVLQRTALVQLSGGLLLAAGIMLERAGR